MRTLGSWIVAGLAVAIGYAVLGAGFGPLAARDLGVGALLLASALGAVAIARAYCAPYRAGSWSLAAVVALALARGLFAAANDDPQRWRGPRGAPAGLLTLRVEGASHPGPRCRVRVRSGDVALWIDAPPESCPLASGQLVRVPAAALWRHEGPMLPGAPEPGALAHSRGAVARATVGRVWLAGGEASAYWSWVARQRQRAWEATRGRPARAFVVASALGVRNALSPPTRAQVRRAGLGHLIAVSGLHVGLAAWALLVLSQRIGGRFGGAHSVGVCLSWLPLVGYVLLTGASPPAVRAGLMAVGMGLGAILGRPHHGPVLLAATCVVMLVVRPAWIGDPGFQLSAAAMATLVRAAPGEGLLRSTWRVTWVLLPLSLWHFGQAGVWGVVSNLVAVPVFTLWILPLGLVGWVLAPWLGWGALMPAEWGARLVLDLAAFVARWPSPPSWMVLLVAIVALSVAVLAGRRDAHGQLSPRWSWLPPAPVALAVIVVLAWPRAREVPPDLQWWAAGSPRAPAVVTVSSESDAPVGCVHQVALAPERWPALLDATGLDGVGWASASEPFAPHEHALVAALEPVGRWRPSPRCGEAPPVERVEAGLEACRRRAGTRHAMMVGTARGPRCFVAGRWEPVLLDSSALEVSP
ncbi:MAG: ComEC/Rec2 family competence protein [Myxococcota bacterium]